MLTLILYIIEKSLIILVTNIGKLKYELPYI